MKILVPRGKFLVQWVRTVAIFTKSFNVSLEFIVFHRLYVKTIEGTDYEDIDNSP